MTEKEWLPTEIALASVIFHSAICSGVSDSSEGSKPTTSFDASSNALVIRIC